MPGTLPYSTSPWTPTNLVPRKAARPAAGTVNPYAPAQTTTEPGATTANPAAATVAPVNPASTTSGSNAVLQTAQNKVLQQAGQPSTTLDLTSQRTQELLKDPSMGYNPQQAKRLALDQYNRGSAQQLEALRQSTAPVANTGANLRDLITVALQTNEGRSDLANQMDLEAQQKRQADLLAALAEGRGTAGTEATIAGQGIQNLVNVANAGEGAANREFQGTQNQLDRDTQVFLQQQGIDLEKAQLYGYQDQNGNWVKGSAEIAAEKAGIDLGDYNLRRTQLLGGVDANGNYVEGTMQMEAKKLGLESTTVENQTKELFGWTDANGQVHPGKYDLLTAEQKREADRQYGYFDQNGQWMPGELETARWQLETELAFNEKGMAIEAVMANLQNLPGEQAAQFLRQFAADNGITIPEIPAEEQAKMQIEDINAKVAAGEQITPAEYGTLQSDPQFMRSVPEFYELPSMYLESERVEGLSWRNNFTPEAKAWLDSNIGSKVRVGNDIFIVDGYWEPSGKSSDRNKNAFITLRNLGTGQTVSYNGNQGIYQ